MNLHRVPGSNEPTRRAFSADDLRRMIETGILAPDERVELIEGELVVMNAAGFVHERIKTTLGRRLGRVLPEELFVGIEVSVQLSTRSIVQPDIVIGPDSAVMRTNEGFLTIPANAILLVVEIASSSLAFDRGRKARLYAREGIAEYWVVDANTRGAWMYGDPAAEGYGRVIPVAADGELCAASTALAGFAITLDALV